MARRQVTVLNEDNTPNRYITHREAFDLVNQKEADWLGTRTVRMHAVIVRARGTNSVFTDVWQLRPSGGIRVWQMRSL